MTEKTKEDKFKKAFPESAKILGEQKDAVTQALFDMKDTFFQGGLAWRKKQVESVRVLISNGWNESEILREFRHHGMTEPTARKIIEDANC
jgi:hypothetical protein